MLFLFYIDFIEVRGGGCIGAEIIPDLVLIVVFNSVFREKPCLFFVYISTCQIDVCAPKE